MSISSPSGAGSGAPIAGSVLPIRRAEELLLTLPGVVSAKIVASDSGAVSEIHVLTTAEYTPKQTVRNIESALIAHLGMRVDHRKISVATSVERPPVAVVADRVERERERERVEQPRPVSPPPVVADAPPVEAQGAAAQVSAAPASSQQQSASPPPPAPPVRERVVASGSEFRDLLREVDSALSGVVQEEAVRRRLYFEDVEVRRSRARGMLCRVTLRKGEQSYTGEAEGLEGERARIDLAARAALKAIGQAERGERTFALDGVKLIEAFDRQWVFVGVTAQGGRDRVMLTGSCEIRESAEQASVLAALDATNRWIAKDSR